jgi:hypothetical protein
MSDLNCSEYSEKAIVVRGEATKTYKEDLKTLGGKYNASLRGGAGWIFSKTSEGKVNKFITSVNNGEVKPAQVKVVERPVTVYKPQNSFSGGVEHYTSLLQDIKDKMEGKDAEYKLSFLSSVTLLLTEKSKLVQRPTVNITPSSDEEEEEAPPRMRLLK